ncbi:MAG TPA: energy transducer TonB [Steroidobacteraceae bacterium]
MMEQGIYRVLGRRSAFGVAIVGVHLGIVGWFLLGPFQPARQAQAPTLLIDFVEKTEAVMNPLKQSNPTLAAVAPVSVELPDVQVATEPDVISGAVPVTGEPAAASSPVVTQGKPANGLPALSDVAYLQPPIPRYPPESRRAREEGLVILRVLIDESGHASNINVYRSSGHPRLDEAAREAVRRALFKPYRDSGVARAAVAMVPVEFSLHG